jgi:hypothetical protein
LAFNSNNDSPGVRFQPDLTAPPGAETSTPIPPATAADAPVMSPGAAATSPIPISSDNPQSAAFARFASCRWQQPAEDGNAAFCTHREVKPYAGTAGFDADAWCPECQYYKLRRAPKKRTPQDEYSY